MTPLEGALDLIARSLPVFPLQTAVPKTGGGFICACGKLSCTSPAKHPLGRIVPNGHKDASIDRAKVEHWFSCYPQANIGVATGSILVVDVDPRNGGNQSLYELEQAYGKLPPTWRALTGGGGQHIFFAPPAGKNVQCTVLADGIDLKASGGYIVAPPSLHISGNQYAWSPKYHPDAVPLAPFPQWLSRVTFEQAASSGPSTDWSAFAQTKHSAGNRNKTLAKFAGHLLRRNVDALVAFELLTSWNETHCTPPLDLQEVRKTIDSIAGRELRRRTCKNG
jgi:hypothetical protein